VDVGVKNSKERTAYSSTVSTSSPGGQEKHDISAGIRA
jgi:hypothetical protein